MYASIILTGEEMAQLDEEYESYGRSDTVYLAGNLPDDDYPNPPLVMEVNGQTNDNWLYWSDTPENIRKRLLAAAQ